MESISEPEFSFSFVRIPNDLYVVKDEDSYYRYHYCYEVRWKYWIFEFVIRGFPDDENDDYSDEDEDVIKEWNMKNASNLL